MATVDCNRKSNAICLAATLEMCNLAEEFREQAARELGTCEFAAGEIPEITVLQAMIKEAK